MKPACFEYVQPTLLVEALEAKARNGEDARFLAGGQSLVPAMNFRMAQPKLVIDLNRLEGGCAVEVFAGEVRIGALARYRDLERDAGLLSVLPILADALPLIAHPQIRSRTTLGGNLAHADPASEMPAIALALEARFRLVSRDGERVVAAEDFFLGPLTTALEPDELLLEVIIPRPPSSAGMCFVETSRRRGDFAIVGVAVMLMVEDRICRSARIALCGVADRPVLSSVAMALEGSRLASDDLAAAGAQVQREIDPPGSLHASAAYQRHLAGVLTQRALVIARDRALLPGSRT